MKCLTPEKTLTGDCEFLAANLYAKSMFGESALANLSIEVGSNGFVQGTFMVFTCEMPRKIDNNSKIIQVTFESVQRVRVWQSVWEIRSTNRKRKLEFYNSKFSKFLPGRAIL